MIEWRPTHLSPPGGLPMWTEPDPAAEPVAHLDEGLQVELSVLRGSWAEVICSNEFRAWVDAQRLVPISAPSPPPVPSRAATPNRRALWIGVGVAAAVAIAVIVIASRGGGGKTTTASSTGSGASQIELHVPAGWSKSADGLTVAEKQADLTASNPTGGRVRAAVVNSDRPVLDVIANAIDAASGASLGEDPTETKVSGVDAVSVGIEQNGITERVIYVHPLGKDAVVFTLEAPTATFATTQTDLASVPGLAL